MKGDLTTISSRLSKKMEATSLTLDVYSQVEIQANELGRTFGKDKNIFYEKGSAHYFRSLFYYMSFVFPEIAGE